MHEYSSNLAAVDPISVMVGGAMLLVLVLALLFMTTRYRRCKPNQILVVYGTIGGNKSAKCLHGGGAFVAPLIQDCAYLSLEPFALKVEFTKMPTVDQGAATGVISLTAQIGTDPLLMHNAAERLLTLERHHIEVLLRETTEQALSALFLEQTCAAQMADRHQLRRLLRERLNAALAPLGLELIGLEIPSFSLMSPHTAAAAVAPTRSLS